MHEFLNRLTTSQLLKLINRYDLKAQYKNPQKRRMALIRELRTYWSKNPVEDCAICLEENSFDHMVITQCAHLFCDTCLIPYIRTKEKCPMCRRHCSYIEVIGQLSKDRFIKVRNIIHPRRATLTTPVQVINYETRHPIQICAAITLTCAVFALDIILIFVFILVILG